MSRYLFLYAIFTDKDARKGEPSKHIGYDTELWTLCIRSQAWDAVLCHHTQLAWQAIFFVKYEDVPDSEGWEKFHHHDNNQWQPIGYSPWFVIKRKHSVHGGVRRFLLSSYPILSYPRSLSLSLSLSLSASRVRCVPACRRQPRQRGLFSFFRLHPCRHLWCKWCAQNICKRGFCVEVSVVVIFDGGCNQRIFNGYSR